MLEKLLAEIQAGGSLDTVTLAEKLNTSPELVRVMLEHLERSGHIRSYAACDTGCGECGLKNMCSSAQATRGVKLWQA